jgi:hypothetical protein
MAIKIKLPHAIDLKLTEYCKTRGITKSEAITRALDSFLSNFPEPTSYELGKDGFGADQTHSGDIAKNSKQRLRKN